MCASMHIMNLFREGQGIAYQELGWCGTDQIILKDLIKMLAGAPMCYGER